MFSHLWEPDCRQGCARRFTFLSATFTTSRQGQSCPGCWGPATSETVVLPSGSSQSGEENRIPVLGGHVHTEGGSGTRVGKVS